MVWKEEEARVGGACWLEQVASRLPEDGAADGV